MRTAVYGLMLANLALAASLLWLGRYTLGGDVVLAFLSPLPAIAGGIFLQRRGHRRIGSYLECFGCLALIAISTVVLHLPLASTSAPYADAWLANADRLLGFHYRAALDFVLPTAPLLKAAYSTFVWQACLVPAVLCLVGDIKRAWTFLLIFSVVLAITGAMFPFFPAQGPVAYFGVPSSYASRIGNLSWYAPAVLQAAREGVRQIDQGLLTGLVSFPSFHAAAGLLFVWGVWPLRLLRYPVLLLNLSMCFAAIFVGDHYVIDIIAGIALAAMVLLVWTKVCAIWNLQAGSVARPSVDPRSDEVAAV